MMQLCIGHTDEGKAIFTSGIDALHHLFGVSGSAGSIAAANGGGYSKKRAKKRKANRRKNRAARRSRSRNRR